MMGRKFRSSWGPGMTLISFNTSEQANEIPLENSFNFLATYVNGRQSDDVTSMSIVQRQQILGGKRNDGNYQRLFQVKL